MSLKSVLGIMSLSSTTHASRYYQLPALITKNKKVIRCTSYTYNYKTIMHHHEIAADRLAAGGACFVSYMVMYIVCRI